MQQEKTKSRMRNKDRGCVGGGREDLEVGDKRKQAEIERPILVRLCSASTGRESQFMAGIKMGRILADEDDLQEIWNENEGRQDSNDIATLLQAVEAVTQLAAMDSVEYQRRLVNNTVPSTNHSHLHKLSQSIHRLQSTTDTLTTEYDRQTTEVVELQNQLNESQSKVIKLEKAVSKLYNRNTKLTKKCKKEKAFIRKLVEQLKQFQEKAKTRKDDAEFYQLADKVQQHEQILRQLRSDSSFSDLDSLVGGMSTKFLGVTEDGIATVKIHRERTYTWPKLEDDEEKPSVIDLQEEADTWSGTKTQSTQHFQMDSNPFVKFLAPWQAQSYTLSLKPPCSLQFVAIPTASTASDDDQAEIAFCVCGFHGFDSSINSKPTLGARLLAINKEPVDPSWVIQDLEEKLQSISNTQHLTFQNNKWNDKQKELLDLAISEQKRLHPKQQGENMPFLRRRAQSNGDDYHPVVGFLKFQNHGLPKEGSVQHQPLLSPSRSAKSQDRGSFISDVSAYWQNCKTPSAKGELSFDEEMLAAGLAMPDVAPDTSHGQKNEEVYNVFSAEEKQKVTTTCNNDNPLNSTFSLFWKADTKDDSWTVDNFVTADDTMNDTETYVPVHMSEGSCLSASNDSKTSDLTTCSIKQKSQDSLGDQETSMADAFSPFCKMKQPSYTKERSPCDGVREGAEKMGTKMPNVSERKPPLADMEDPRMITCESATSDGVFVNESQSLGEASDSRNDSSLHQIGRERNSENSFALFWKSLDKGKIAKSDDTGTRSSEQQENDKRKEEDNSDTKDLAFLPRKAKGEGVGRQTITQEKGSNVVDDFARGFASFWKQNQDKEAEEKKKAKKKCTKTKAVVSEKRSDPLLICQD